MSVLRGNKILLWTGSGASKKCIAYSTNHVLNLGTETSDSSSKDSGRYASKEISRLNWSGSCDALVAADGANLKEVFALWKAGAEVTLTIGIPTNYVDTGLPSAGWTSPTSTADIYFTGAALLTSASFNAQNGSNATMSISFEGNGELKDA